MEHDAPETPNDLEPERNEVEPQADGSGESADDNSAEQIIVDDTWRVLGMEGTGSKDVLAQDLFVPAHRAIDTRELMKGSSPYTLNHATNLYRVSADSVLSGSVPAAILGSAKFALEKFIERTKERRAIVTGARKAEHGSTQLRLAESMAELKCAELFVHDAAKLMA